MNEFWLFFKMNFKNEFAGSSFSDNQDFVNWHYFSGNEYIGSLTLSISSSSLFFTNYEEGFQSEVQTLFSAINEFRLLITLNKSVVALFDNRPVPVLVKDLDMKWLEPLDSKKFARPVFNADDNTLAGFTSYDTNKNGVFLDPSLGAGARGKFHTVVEQVKSAEGYLLGNGIYFSDKASTVAVNYYDEYLSKNSFLSSKGDDLHLECKYKQGFPPKWKDHSPKLTLKHSSSSLPFFQSSNSPSNKAAVVFLRGGPTTSLFDQSLYTLFNIYPAEEYSFFMYEYSGAVGVSEKLSQSISLGKEKSLDADIESLCKEILALSMKHTDVILHAESFSGILGLGVSQRCGDKISKTVLLSPWLKYLPSEKYIPVNNLLASDPSRRSYKLFNANYFNIKEASKDDSFRRWMNEILNKSDLEVEVLIIFPKHENRIDVDFLMRHYEGAPNVRTALVPGYHSTVRSTDVTYNLIREFVD